MMSDKSQQFQKYDKSQKRDVVKIENSAHKSKVEEEHELIAEFTRKRLASMTEEQIIEENLKELLENKSREERKANGRLVAVLVACLVIFLAIYHAWIRKTAVLAGILVPAVIMLGYGGWVVILAKRDKRKRAMFEKHVEEVAMKNKAQLEEKAKSKQAKSEQQTKIHFENEIVQKQSEATDGESNTQMVTVQIEDHRKQRKRRGSKQNKMAHLNCNNKMEIPSIHVNKENQTRRPSIRQKFFRQNATLDLYGMTKLNAENIMSPQNQNFLLQEKRKKLQRMDTIPMPQIIRMSSAP